MFKRLRFRIRLTRMIEWKKMECAFAQIRFDEKISKTQPQIIYWQHWRLKKIYNRNFENQIWT